MAKKTKSISSAANDENLSPVPLEDTATMTGAPVAVSGAVDESVSTAIHNPESNGTSEGSSDPAAPAPAGAIESDPHTPQSASGAAAGKASAELVKPLTGSDPIEVIVAETDTPTFVSTSPDVEAAASGTNSEPSQGAADDDGSMAGSVHALVIEAGAESVEQLLVFADLGKRVFKAFSAFGFDALEWINAYETGTPAWLTGSALAEGPDQSMTSIISVDRGGRISPRAIRVKSTRDGFRRAGLVHSKAGLTFAPDELTEKQLEVLDDDPSITIEYL